MDPGLWELCEAGSEEDEVSVIIRLKDEARLPPDVRVISRFGKIVTVRLQRGGIQSIHDSDEVVSMKASWSLGEGEGLYDNNTEELDVEFKLTHPSSAASPISVEEDGSGVTVGICDWGFDFTHENFRNEDGTTRLLALWDQAAEGGETPKPYGYGRVYTREDINNALATPDPTSTLGYHPSKGDPRGNGAHGTHVADILAGNRREPGSEMGIASAAEIVFVHLATQRMRALENFGDSVRLLEGLDFVRNQAGEGPLVAHFSAGKTGGSHNGTALFEQAVDALVLERPGIALVQSVGNYAASRMHTHGRLGPDHKRVLHWLISSRDRTPNELEVWYSGQDIFELALVAPNGARFEASLGENVKLIQDDIRWGTLYHRKGEPNSKMNHIDIILRTASPAGRYRVELRGRDIVDGRYHAWIERDASGRHQSHFTRRQATSEYTTNTICNSFRGIAVGAYDAKAKNRPPTRFTSRGPTADGRQKPEIAAPGNRIRAARSLPADGWKGESHLTIKSGTSMAAPFVSGTVALMMQAAGRPLSITEVRRLLIGTADPTPLRSGRISTRLGYGYLNTVAAVEAARQLGRQGSVEQDLNVAADREEQVESSTEWLPHWIVDSQPFGYAAKNAVAMDSEASNQDDEEYRLAEALVMEDETQSLVEAAPEEWDTVEVEEDGLGVEEDGSDLGSLDADYDEVMHDDVSFQTEEEDQVYHLADALVMDDETPRAIESGSEEWDAAESEEFGLEVEESDSDLGSQDKDDGEVMHDDMSFQTEEEDPVYHLAEALVMDDETPRAIESGSEEWDAAESEEFGLEVEESDSDLGSQDKDDGEVMHDDMSFQTKEEDPVYRLAEALVMDDETPSDGEADPEEWDVTESEEFGLELEEDGNDFGSLDEDDENTMREDMSRQEEEEDEAYLLSKLYNTLEKLAERDPIDG